MQKVNCNQNIPNLIFLKLGFGSHWFSGTELNLAKLYGQVVQFRLKPSSSESSSNVKLWLIV